MEKKLFYRIIVIMLSIVFCVALPATAEDKKEPVVYELISYLERSDSVRKVQVMLEKLGYFQDSPPFEWGVFDDATVEAIRLFCDDHHFVLSSDGISPEVQKYLLEESPSPRVTASPTPLAVTPTPDNAPTPFPVLRQGDRSVVISYVQKALSDKGYYEGVDGFYVPGQFDEVTEVAVDRFCKVIGARYMPEEGLTESLYLRIVATDAPLFPKPTPTPFSIIFFGTVSDEVRSAQQRLSDLEYFRDLGNPEWNRYDEITQRAVELFCKENGIPVHPNGMDPIFWERLYNQGAKPNPIAFEEIHRGDSNENVNAVQDRLFALGYYKNRQRTGLCDDDMITALNLFAQANNVAFENETVTMDLYRRIMDEGAVSFSEKILPEPSFFEQVQMFLVGNVSFLGIQMPMFLVILLVVIILAGLTFLLIHTFSADNKKPGGKSAKGGSVTDSWNPAGGSGEGMRRVELEIRYRGSSQRVAVNLDKPLRIGRTEHTLPINESDSDISRQHCQIYFRGDALLLRDYSTNGTTVNHKPYHNCECVIRSGDTVCVGNHEITVRIL